MSATVEINKDVLRVAITGGEETLKAFLTMKDGKLIDRPEQVARSKQALYLMRIELPDLRLEDRKRAIEVCKRLLQGVLDDVHTNINRNIVELSERVALETERREAQEAREMANEDLRKISNTAETIAEKARDTTNDFFNIDGPWIPNTLNPLGWNKKQAALVATVTVGAVSAIALWKWMRKPKEKKKAEPDEAKKEKKGIPRWAYWLPGIGLGLVGIGLGYNYLKKFDSIGKQLEHWGKWAKDKLPFMGKDKEGKYGLAPETLKDAEEAYRIHGESNRDEIAKVFGLKPEETSPEFEQFMKDRKEHHRQDERGRVQPSVALENYQEDLGTALREFGKWLEQHSFEIAVGTVIAARLHILHAILHSGKTVVVKAYDLGKMMVKWGINHPVLSLFLIGGSIGALATKAMKQGTRLPQNLKELSVACLGHEPFDVGEIANTTFVELQEHMKKVGPIAEEFGPWVEKQMETLLKVIAETAPGAFALTAEELIAQNNIACFRELHDHIALQLSHVKTADRSVANSGKGKKCLNAMELLDEFETEYARARCTDFTDADAAPEIFQRLTVALQEIDIGVEEEDGVIKWKDKNMPQSFDLCVSLSVRDRKELELKSKRLRQKETWFTYLGWNALDQVRQMEQKALNAGEKLTENKTMAMIIGNFLYVFEDYRNSWNYLMIPVDMFFDTAGLLTRGKGFENPLPPFHGDAPQSRNWTDWGANFTSGAISCTIFSLNAAWLMQLKRLAVGGGRLQGTRLSRIAWNVTPGFSQINLLRNAADTANDIRVIKRFGYLQGRRYNFALAKAGVQPDWIAKVEVGTEARIRNIAQKAAIKLGKSTDVKVLREEFREGLKHVLRVEERHWLEIPQHIKRSGLKFWEYPGAFKKAKIAYQGSLYSEMMVAFGDIEELVKQGADLEMLVEGGADIRKLVAARVGTQDLMDAGVSTEKLLAAGIGEAELIARGVPQATITQAKQAVEAAAETQRLSGLNQKLVKAMTNRLGDAAKAQDCLDLFKAQGLDDPKTLRLFTDSPRSQKLLAAAMNSPNPAGEMQRLLNAARTARNWRVGIAAVGVTGDVFGVIMAVADFANNHARIEEARKTGNAELAAMYGSAYPIYTVQGGTSVIGLAVAGFSVKAAVTSGAGILAGIGAPMSVVMAPITAGVLAVAYTHGKLIEGAEYLLKREQDLVQCPPGMILEHVGKSKEDQRVNWIMGRLASMNTGVNYASADQMARVKGYTAYFLQLSDSVLPSVTDLDVKEINEQALKTDPNYKPAISEARKEQLQKERTAIFVQDALKYISHASKGTYEVMDAEGLRNAELFASMCFNRRSTGEQVKSFWVTKDKNYDAEWGSLDAEVAAFRDEQKKVMCEDLSNISQNKTDFAAQAPYILLVNAQHDLADCERRILTENYSNWSGLRAWTGWRGEEDMQAIARGIAATKVREVLKNASEKAPLNAETATNVFENLQKMLRDFQPDTEALNAMKGASEYAAATMRTIGAGPALLTVPGMQNFLSASPLLANTTTSAVDRIKANKTAGEAYLNGALGPREPGKEYWELGTGLSTNLNPLFQFVNGRWAVRWFQSKPWMDPATALANGEVKWGGGKEQSMEILTQLAAYNNQYAGGAREQRKAA